MNIAASEILLSWGERSLHRRRVHRKTTPSTHGTDRRDSFSLSLYASDSSRDAPTSPSRQPRTERRSSAEQRRGVVGREEGDRANSVV